MKPYYEIGKRLERHRQEAGFTSRNAFAKHCGVNTGTYRYQESGETEPSIEDLICYSKKLYTSLRYLLCGDKCFLLFDVKLDEINVTDISDQMEIGIRLEVARRASGYQSRKEFAEKCGVDQSTVRLHEVGRAKAGIFILMKYCQTLRLSLYWLLTGKGTPVNMLSPEDEFLSNAIKMQGFWVASKRKDESSQENALLDEGSLA